MSDDITFGDRINRHLSQQEATLTGKRFCTTCQSPRAVEGGEKLKNRWICADCIQRRRTRTGQSLYSKRTQP